MPRSLPVSAYPPTFSPAPGALLPRGWLGLLLAWQDRWRQRRDLQALSDEQLADIGLTPADVRSRSPGA